MDHHEKDKNRNLLEKFEGVHAFRLRLQSDDPKNSTTFRCLAIFPWELDSLNTVWSGEHSSTFTAKWQKVVEKWSGVVAVGGGRKLRLLLNRDGWPLLCLFSLDLPDDDADIRCIVWCLVIDDVNIYPLIAFSGNSVLYVFNVEKMECHGVMRGHGGTINTLAVYSSNPSLLISTSHDYSCRIYDLRRSVNCHIRNPRWPSGWNMSYGGPAFGLHSNNGEGFGHGRCIAVLAGGQSGGHQAPILGVASHPTLPLIATCGMDHAVKIWQMPRSAGNRIHREDKPLFSSTRIHNAQVLSIAWIGQDMLVSNSGPAIMKEDKEVRQHPGTVVLWHWLGIDRFLPSTRDHHTSQQHMRGCASDYLESSSFKIITEYQLPPSIQLMQLHVFQSQGHNTVIVIPSHGSIHLASLAMFTPRNRCPFPYTVEPEDELTEKARNLCLGNEEPPELPFWTIEVKNSEPKTGSRAMPVDILRGSPKLMSCIMGENGRLLIGAGEKESIWIWHIPVDEQPTVPV